MDRAAAKAILDQVYGGLLPEEMERLKAAAEALDLRDVSAADIWGYCTTKLIGKGATAEELHEAIDAFMPLHKRG